MLRECSKRPQIRGELNEELLKDYTSRRVRRLALQDRGWSGRQAVIVVLRRG